MLKEMQQRDVLLHLTPLYSSNTPPPLAIHDTQKKNLSQMKTLFPPHTSISSYVLSYEQN